MTSLQVEANKLRETQRSNLAKEQETNRSNLAQESLKDRSIKLDEAYQPVKMAEGIANANEKNSRAVKNYVDAGEKISKEVRLWVSDDEED